MLKPNRFYLESRARSQAANLLAAAVKYQRSVSVYSRAVLAPSLIDYGAVVTVARAPPLVMNADELGAAPLAVSHS